MDVANQVSPTRVGLLDGFALDVAGSSPGSVAEGLPHGAQRLIAQLCLCGHPRREAIAGQLWPDVPEAHAHGSLRSALWRVQKAVPGLVVASGGGLRLARDVSVDAQELTVWAHRVLGRRPPPDASSPEPGPAGRPAVAHPARAPSPDDDGTDPGIPEIAFRGELLPGWYDDWVLLERERLRQLRLHALEAAAGRLAAAGRYGEAIEAAGAAMATEPLRESAHRALVRVHLAEGNLTEAVASYRAFRTLLADELGVKPTAQMNALVRGLSVDRPERDGWLPRVR